MVDIVTRLGKGSPLTNAEVDANFTNLAEVSGVTGEPMGHEDRTTSTISFNASTRTFTIAPTASSFTVWCKGKKVVVSSARTVTIPNTTGMYSIYFDSTGTLAAKSGYFTFSDEAPTAYVYWNATTGTAPYFGDERHGVVLDWQTHEYLHRTRGAALASGFSASGYVLGGNGSSNSHAQITLEGGTFFDEDMKIIVTATNTPTAGTWEQDLVSPARIPVLYLSGTGWVIDSPTDYPLKQGTARPQYNAFSGGVWSTADVANNKYATSWILATNNLTYPVIAIIGQAESDLQSAAEAVDFTALQLPGFPSVEFRPLYKLIFQCADSCTNAVHASLVSITDIRSIVAAGTAASIVTDHGNLSGLSDDDHPQYLSVDTVRGSLTAAVKASFLPSQTSNAGKFLQTDGTATSWQALTSGNVTTALGFTPYNATNPSGYISGITSGMVTTALGFTPYNATNPSGYVTAAGARGSISVTGAGSYDSATGVINIVGGVTSFNTRTGAITLSSSDVTTALGFTPYNSTNPNGYLTGITSTQVTTALGYTPYNSSNPSGYITGITSGMVTTALGFTPYNNSNPSGYITSSALSPYLTTASAASTYLALSGGTMTGSLGLHSTSGTNGFYNGTGDGASFSTYNFLLRGWNGMAFQNPTSGGTYPNSITGYLDFREGIINMKGGFRVNGSVVLYGDNYNSYAPTLTGTGASGTWGISISGNAATVTNGLYKVGTNAIPAAVVLNTTADNWMWQWASSGSNDWYLGPTTANFGIGGSRLAISSSGSSPNAELSIERGTTRLLEILQANLQYKGNVVLHAGNYNSYAPTLTGTGASGTWGISITGNAATATNATNATNLTGGTLSSSSGVVTGSLTIGTDAVGGVLIQRTISGWQDIVQVYRAGTMVWSLQDNSGNAKVTSSSFSIGSNLALHAGNYTSYAATSGHNHTYDVNNAWLRDANDDANVKLYGNTRQMVFRTDGTTEFASGVGGYAFAWMYGGDSAAERRMLLASNGRLWTNYHGWMDEAFAPLSHVHSYLPLSGGTVSGVIGSSRNDVQRLFESYNASAGGPTQFFIEHSYGGVNIGNARGNINISSGSLLHGGNQVLHAGNYSSYALPLSGGSLTGALSAVSGLRSYYSDHIAGDGYGIRFWESNAYKISMGVSSLYQYGTVTDYSIKMQMDNGSPGRGFTWGRESYAPVAALNATSGNFQTAGQMYVQGAQIASGALTVRAGGAAGVGWGTGLNIGDSSNYSGFIQDAGISRWRNTGSGGYDWFNSATTQIMALSNSGYLGVGQASDASYRIIASGHIYANGNGNVYAEGRHYSRHGTGTFYESLTTGNYSSYALPLSGGSLSGSLTINNSSPTIYLQDTDNRSAMIHVNSNTFYVLRGSGTNSGSWSTYNGYWPLELNLENNNATFGGSISSVGNTVLHAGNFSSYSHSIATSDSRYSRKDTTSQWIKPYYEYGSYLTSESPATLKDQMGGGGLRVDFMNPSYTGSGNWNHVITWSGYNMYNMYQLGGNYDGGTGTDLWVRSEANHGGTSWTAWRKLLNSSNYNSYSPTLTGGNASGTWGISITGNAGTLQGYQWGSAGKEIRGSDIYADSWLRNYNSGTGLYNQATGNHWYSDGQYWNVGYSGTTGIRLRNGHAGTILGYLYAETNQNMGLLNSSGNWAVQVYPGGTGGGNLAGTWTGGNIRANRANGNFYIDDNYGNGVVGVYSSYRYQGVFAMGDSYKLPADGTTTGSLYGMAWSHPNAGGAAGNLSDHGLLIINNGVFKCAISNSIVASSNITAYSDERLKTNWRDMPEDYVARLAQVKVGIYDRIDEEDVTQVGVSAQSFQELLPQAIMTAKDEMQTLSVSYGNAALASAVELAKDNVELRARIERLESLISKLIGD